MMTIERGRGARRFMMVATLAGAALLSACNKKVGGQVVAVVNDEEITQQELRAEAEAANIQVGQDIRKVGPGILQRVVERNLLADYAREQGLDRGPEYVARRRQLEQTLLASLAMRKIVGTPAKPTQAEVTRFINSQPTIFGQRQRLTLDQVRFPTPADPKQVQALTALGSVAAVEAQLKAQGVNVQRGTPVLDTASVAPMIAKQIVALPNGELFDFSTNGVSFISTITARAAAASPSATWNAPATEAVRREKADQSLKAAMDKMRASAKIEYDPAFKPQAGQPGAAPAAPGNTTEPAKK